MCIQRGLCLWMLPELGAPAPFPAFRENQAAEWNLDGIGKRREVRPQSPSSADAVPPLPPSFLAPPPASIPLVLPSPLAFLHPSLPLHCLSICFPPFPGVFIYRVTQGPTEP